MDRFQAAFHNISSLNRNVRALTAVAFEIGPLFCSGGGPQFYLIVQLPATFPNSAPTFKVSPIFRHHLVDSQGNVLNHSRIKSWTATDIPGAVVADVIRDLTGAPAPTPVGGGGLETIPSPRTASMHRDKNSIRDEVAKLLKNKTAEELDKLISDEDHFLQFVEDNGGVKEMKIVRKDLGESNVKLAQENLKREKELIELREKYEKLALTLKDLQATVVSKRDKRDSLMSKYSGAAVLSKLKQAAKEVEDESDVVSGKFLAKEIDYDSFSKKYLELRISYHERKSKIDLLAKDKGKLLANLFQPNNVQ